MGRRQTNLEEAREHGDRAGDGGGASEAEHAPHGEAAVLQLLKFVRLELRRGRLLHEAPRVDGVGVRLDAAILEHVVAAHRELVVRVGHVVPLEEGHEESDLADRFSGEAEESIYGVLGRHIRERDTLRDGEHAREVRASDGRAPASERPHGDAAVLDLGEAEAVELGLVRVLEEVERVPSGALHGRRRANLHALEGAHRGGAGRAGRRHEGRGGAEAEGKDSGAEHLRMGGSVS
mmetsp:Transcript_54973/g.125134  ORF Transcript_54973/g.125134 Transcript_54973/m.125134 type:complete len:235 (+) Transcript_54973:114-818(+)